MCVCVCVCVCCKDKIKLFRDMIYKNVLDKNGIVARETYFDHVFFPR